MNLYSLYIHTHIQIQTIQVYCWRHGMRWRAIYTFDIYFSIALALLQIELANLIQGIISFFIYIYI